jgi:quaternary ammonium compound-resistance protein SugE
MAWLLLLVASAFEVAFALALKGSHGFTRAVPSVVAIVTGVASVVILSYALRTLPVGTGYAAWTGIGSVGSVILGMALFNEPRDVLRLASIALIIAGVIGLRLTTGAES